MVFNLQTLNEAGVTTPCSLPVDTNDRDIKNAKPIKGTHFKVVKNRVLTNTTPQKVSGMLYTKNLYESGVKSYLNG
jgi:hypothetical protein